MFRSASVLAGLAAFALAGAPAFAMSLKEAVALAVSNNPKIAAAQASQRASEFALDQAKGRFLPEVDVEADAGKQKIDRPNGLGPAVNNVWRFRRQGTINVSQVLFDGFDRANDYYRSQARISAAAQRLMARSEQIALSAVEAYIDVTRHDNLLALAVANVRRHEKLLSLISDRVSGGLAAEGDLAQTRERLEGAKALVAQIRVARETAAAKFKGAVGVGPHGLAAVGGARGVPDSLARIGEAALANNPRMKALAAEVDAAMYDREQFRATLYPQVYLEGSATKGHDLEGTPGKDEEFKGVVVLRWKLYDGGVRRARVAELGEKHAERIAELDAMARQLTEEVETAWARYTTGAAQVATLRRQVEQNTKVVNSYQAEYDANKRSLLDVLDAENSRFGSQFELSNAGALNLFSGYQLLADMGILLETLGIAPPAGAESADLAIYDSGRVSPRKFVIPPLSAPAADGQ
jgi:adhesin transport system outer membrane protein